MEVREAVQRDKVERRQQNRGADRAEIAEAVAIEVHPDHPARARRAQVQREAVEEPRGIRRIAGEPLQGRLIGSKVQGSGADEHQQDGPRPLALEVIGLAQKMGHRKAQHQHGQQIGARPEVEKQPVRHRRAEAPDQVVSRIVGRHAVGGQIESVKRKQRGEQKQRHAKQNDARQIAPTASGLDRAGFSTRHASTLRNARRSSMWKVRAVPTPIFRSPSAHRTPWTLQTTRRHR